MKTCKHIGEMLEQFKYAVLRHSKLTSWATCSTTKAVRLLGEGKTERRLQYGQYRVK
jgi:hypothetical protein